MAQNGRDQKLITRGVVACRACPIRGLGTFREFTPDELAFVNHFKVGEVHLGKGDTLLVEGEASPYVYTVLSGWLFRYQLLDDGRRQIINYAMPGDLVGLQGAVFGTMLHSVEALTDVRLCAFERKRLWSLYERHPALGFDVTWLAAEAKSILADFLVTVGQRSASERIAFILLALYQRAQSVGLVEGNRVTFPFTQDHFADTIGFSRVHTNKRMASLRRSGIFTWSGESFELHDEARLAAIAGGLPTRVEPRVFI